MSAERPRPRSPSKAPADTDRGAESAPDLPLVGTTVIELGTSLAAPYAAMVLAELGAEVIKIESPRGGDPARRWGPPVSEGNSITYQAVNRDKRSITVDLSVASECDRLRRFIIDRADICLQNMRPSAVEKLGLDADTLRASNPGLIYCNMGAFGALGPLSHLPGYDPLMQAFTGICHVTGPGDGEPCRVGVPVIDLGTGMWAVIGIQAALLRRAHTGEGATVDVSLFDTAMGWLTLAMSTVMVTGKTPGRHGTRGPGAVVPNQGFATADGMLLVTSGTDAQFGRLAEALGHPEWREDERFADALARAEHGTALADAIAAVLCTESREHWMTVLERANVPNAPFHSPSEAFAHPHTVASGIVQSAWDGSAAQIALPLRLDGERLPYRRGAPRLGEGNELLTGGGPSTEP